MASIKAHGCAHIPWQMGIMGPYPFNDTDQCESSHVMDKTEYKRTSKRDESTNEEMLGLVSIYVYVRVYNVYKGILQVMRGIRSKTLMHAYDKDTGVLDENKQSGLGYKIIGPIRNSGITFDYGRKRWKFNSRTRASSYVPWCMRIP
jgi:hypothetical protein